MIEHDQVLETAHGLISRSTSIDDPNAMRWAWRVNRVDGLGFDESLLEEDGPGHVQELQQTLVRWLADDGAPASVAQSPWLCRSLIKAFGQRLPPKTDEAPIGATPLHARMLRRGMERSRRLGELPPDAERWFVGLEQRLAVLPTHPDLADLAAKTTRVKNIVAQHARRYHQALERLRDGRIPGFPQPMRAVLAAYLLRLAPAPRPPTFRWNHALSAGGDDRVHEAEDRNDP